MKRTRRLLRSCASAAVGLLLTVLMPAVVAGHPPAVLASSGEPASERYANATTPEGACPALLRHSFTPIERLLAERAPGVRG